MVLKLETPALLQCRLIIVGKKKLPDITRHERFFAFVREFFSRALVLCDIAVTLRKYHYSLCSLEVTLNFAVD